MTKFAASGLVVAVVSFFTVAARAGVVVSVHNGSTNPATEGFGTASFGASSTSGSLANDVGFPAWEIKNTGESSQYGYIAPALTTAQATDFATEGFTLTLVGRVLQNGIAPAYDSTDFITIGGVYTNYNGHRWEIDLGLNSNGDTVVVLPSSVDNFLPGNPIRTPGASYTLTGSGSTYHTYQLEYDAGAGKAGLFVDGTLRISNYAGHTSYVGTSAMVWDAFSGGEANFNLVELQSGKPTAVPEPASCVAWAGLFGLLGMFRLRRRHID